MCLYLNNSALCSFDALNPFPLHCIVLFVFILAGQSFETMSLHEDASVDLVFIDGDHTYEGIHTVF